MDLTMLPSKKTVARWESGMLVIAQGNSVIELTSDQAHKLFCFIHSTMSPAFVRDGEKLDVEN